MNKRQTIAKIKRGMRFIERIVPQARQLIQIDKLDMAYQDTCVLGQVFGSFDKGLAVLDISEIDADRYAFNLSVVPEDENYLEEYNKLTELWKEVLRQ